MTGVNRAPSIVSLQAPSPAAADATALCTALDIAGDVSAAPDWVHLLPAGPTITTVDGRGPYTVPDMHQVIAASLPAGERLVLDENHATDLAAPHGASAPARGWIVELQARADGLWGRVEWTPEGKALVEGRAYRAISPVIEHDKAGRVRAVLRASLVNRANLKDLKTLHQEQDMNLLEKLRKALGLDDTTSEEAVLAAVTSLHQAGAAHATALMSIGAAAGLKDNATVDAIVAAIGKLGEGGGAETITALQAELAAVAGELKALKEQTARATAEAFVDGAIKAGKVGVKPLRDHYVARHMAEPEAVEKEIAALPTLSGRVIVEPRPGKEGEISLNAEQLAVARMLGQDPKDYAQTLKLEREAGEAAL